ncbi:MAG TPA: FTR1 family protein [Alphaproteobacteria bacterium]|nr:FTR1 family protein [Alphaproteobacteria bacterium]
MLATAIIVFREVLEAALVIGIVVAATKGIAGRSRWVSLGLVAGVLAASLVAAFAGTISDMVEGMGQEVFDAGVLFAAVVMLGWHNVWMGRHGREIAAQMSSVGADVQAGRRPLYALSIVVGLAVLREGSEVVLFVYGIAAAGQSGAGEMVAGGVLGLAAGVLAGLVTYFGLVRIPIRRLFTVTSWLILLLAAGMAAQGAGFLMQAGFLPSVGGTLWNTSQILSETSIVGRVLHTLVGYIAEPDGLQVIFYAVTVAVIFGLMRLTRPSPRLASTRASRTVEA